MLISYFNTNLQLGSNKLAKIFTISYIASTSVASLMLTIRGTLDVLIRVERINELSKGIDAMISGVSGIAHIALPVSIIVLFVLWIKKIMLPKNKI